MFSERLERIIEEMVAKGILLRQARAEFERKFILTVLRRNGGNKTKAAREMGIHRNTLHHKIQNLNILPEHL